MMAQMMPGGCTSQRDVQTDTIASPVASARAAGLRYVTDTSPGIRRKRAGKHFSYIGLDGKPIHDEEVLQRIRSLGIPPAWKDVWICPNPRGHIQATGRDAKGRKQYRYHALWRKIRDDNKYDHMVAFGKALPTIRQRVSDDLALPGLPGEKVLATVVRLLDTTSVRIGNEEYARENGSFGLTTMRDEHVEIKGSTVRFQFRGKSGKEHSIDVKDRQLAKIMRRCLDLPGQELFQYIDEDGQQRTVTSDDVNAYLHEVTGQDFTAKDFRTWAGTVTATCALLDLGAYETKTQAKKNVVHAIESAAQHLGNTPAICRKSYVHPEVIDSYLDGSLLHALKKQDEGAILDALEGLRPEEISVLAFLEP
ncbi:MAG: DNA topoisomerase IB [Ktedonobacteraceae bacterium]|nr:DNA topoisomerase IB [Ktedonobacteraceae bacterium]